MAVYHHLKEAARQLSGSRPGVICVQFRNMTSAELRDLAEHPAQSGQPTGIQLMTAKFYDDSTHGHVHTILFRSAAGARVGSSLRREHAYREVQLAPPDFLASIRRESILM